MQIMAELNDIKRKCEEYAQKNGLNIVFGDGNPNAEILLLGEAPGREEIEQGKPFVGKAGKNLDEFLKVPGLLRKDIYITNVVKSRPYKINPKTGRASNRPPTKQEISDFKPFLIEEINCVSPKLILTLGNVALNAVIDEKVTIGNMHGEITSSSPALRGIKVYPLYHPASIIYNQSLKESYMKDLLNLRIILAKHI